MEQRRGESQKAFLRTVENILNEKLSVALKSSGHTWSHCLTEVKRSINRYEWSELLVYMHMLLKCVKNND